MELAANKPSEGLKWPAAKPAFQRPAAASHAHSVEGGAQGDAKEVS